MPAPDATGWVDGRRVALDDARVAMHDPAFQAGLGLFETIAVRNAALLELDEHLARMRQAAERLDVPLPEKIRQAALEMAASAENCAWLKIVATRAGRCAIFTGAMDPAEEGRSVSAVLLPWRRNPFDPLAGLKTLNYAASVLGLEEAARRGADEGLWLNTRGHLTEGCTSNLFVIRHRRVYTAALRDGILPGVVRDLTLAAARALGHSIHEGKLRLKRLETADEAFLTSSLRAIRPLVRYENRPVGSGRPGPMTRALADELRRRRILSS